MNKKKDQDIREHALEIFRQTRRDIDPLVLLRTRQIIEKHSGEQSVDALVQKETTDVRERNESDIPVDRTKMCEIVMEYLAIQSRAGGSQEKIGALLKSALDSTNT